MNGNKAKHRKRGKRGLKTKNGEAEVFVLPPDLLQKLGINLGNVGTNEGPPKVLPPSSPDTATDLPYSLPNPDVAPASYHIADVDQPKKDTSILETAILMKNSVLLSPTFMPNGIQGELEISSKLEINKVNNTSAENKIRIEEVEHDLVDVAPNAAIVPKSNECDLHPDKLMDEIRDKYWVNDKNEGSSIVQPEVYCLSPVGQDLKNLSQLSNSINANTITALENSEEIITSTDDHPDEAYSSDSNNSNMGLTEKNDNIINIPEIHSCKTSDLNSNSKINIICEEILSSSQLKKLKTFHSPKLSDFIPVPVSTVITGNKKNLNLSSDNLRVDKEKQIRVLYPDDDTHINEVLGKSRTNLHKTENFVLYDDKGSVIPTGNNNETTVSNELQIKVISVEDKCDVMTMINSQNEISDIIPSGLSHTENQEFSITKNSVYSQYSPNGACISFVVPDIEQHFEDNEELIQKIVEEISSDKTDLLLDKIENNDQACLNSSDNKLAETRIVTNKDVVASNYILDSEINQIDKICKKDLNCVNIHGKVLNDNEIVAIGRINEDNFLSKVEGESVDKLLNDKNQAIVSISNESALNPIGLEQKEVMDNPSEFLNELAKKKPFQKVINENYSATRDNKKNTEHSKSVCISKSNICQASNTALDSLSKDTVVIDKRDSNLNIESISNTDKVEEIAMYLSQFASHHSNRGKNKSRTKLYKNKKGSIDRSKHENLKSKLCKQGVEKPGGLQDEKVNYKKPKILRTYARTRSYLPIAISLHDIKKEDEQKNLTTIMENKTNNLSLSHRGDIEVFCICEDFGRMDYYDYDRSYEHIHFWEHKNINCNDADVFSMYNQDYTINAGYNENVETCEQESVENIAHAICWNDLENLDVSKNSLGYVGQSNVNLTSNDAVETDLVSVVSGSSKIDITDQEPGSKLDAIKMQIPVCNFDERKGIDKNVFSAQNFISETEKAAIETIRFHSNESSEESMVNSAILKDHIIVNKTQNADYEPYETDTEMSKLNNTIETSKGASDTNGFEAKSEKSLFKYGAKKCKLPCKQDESTVHQETDVTVCTNSSEAGKLATKKKEIDNNETEKSCVESRRSSKKRKLSSGQYCKDDSSPPHCKKTVKCGVCKQLFTEVEWEKHVSEDHCLIAWRAGNSFDFENPELLERLQQKIKTNADLKCTFCDNQHQDVTNFLLHVYKCWKMKESTHVHNVLTSMEDTSKENQKLYIKCGVCKTNLNPECWMKHLAEDHSYLAWKEGEPSLDIDKEEDIREHLRSIVNQLGKLICSKCGLERKYVKSYLNHIKNCSDPKTDESALNETSDVYHNANSSTESIISSLDKSAQDVISNNNIDSKERRKRSSSMLPLNNKIKSEESESDTTYTTCGVCEAQIAALEWFNHIEKHHNYLAWKNEETKLDLNDEEVVRKHLYNLTKELGGLTCSKCGLTRKYVKAYLSHIKSCSAMEDSNVKLDKEPLLLAETPAMVKCSVCGEEVEYSAWYDHIGKEHQYMAWKEGEPPVDFGDEEKVRLHLYDISKQCGGLTCHKCGYNRKYVKVFLQHLKTCNGSEVATESMVKEMDSSELVENTLDDSLEENQTPIQCGVCQKEVKPKEWISHIQRAHNYLAWKTGEALNLQDPQAVNDHLYSILMESGGLTCNKCGLLRKYVKVFLKHIESCDATPFEYDTEIPLLNQDEYVCAVCSKKVAPNDWLDHKMNIHYNVAWIVGEQPIDIRNPYMVERFLKVYKEKYCKLVCNICGTSRASCVGFYAHVVVCGKTEEEAEEFYNVCEVCNKKYLCLYHNQHMAIHTQQEYMKQRKLKEAEAQSKAIEEIPMDIPSGRRRAAEKARNVIENYKTSLGEAEFEDNMSDELSEPYSDSGTSLSSYSDDELSESDVDSAISDEEKMSPIKKRPKSSVAVSAKIERFPYSLLKAKPYLLKSAQEYSNFHFSNEKLFLDWHACEFEPVTSDQVLKYLPSLEESCKVKLDGKDWETYKRFEGQQSCIFVGASIRCVSWAPPSVDHNDDNYLAVACHSGVDCPRFKADEMVEHSNLIQIWNFGNFSTVPKFVLGLAHDYGTVWSMDWCPSGVRDSLSESLETDNKLRLGLLAVACSNGLGYIFSVPYPSRITQNDTSLFKLKPMVELRLLMGSDRTRYPATSLSWSQQKGHSLLVIGYGDGTVAYYDLVTESPLLKTKENNVTVLYPHHDERVHSTCVTGVDIYPSADEASSGAVCSSAPTGGAAVLRAGLQPVRTFVSASAAAAKYQPLWPSALLSGDDAIIHTMPTEVEWFGGGRRLGGISAIAPCVRCARVAVITPPLLRLMRVHPAGDLIKQTVGSLTMTSLGKKRKHTIDELAIKVEPTTYEEAVTKYGIELILDEKIQAPNANKPCNPDPGRFPLADVPSLAFCTSTAHHNKLAVATHAGIIFLINV